MKTTVITLIGSDFRKTDTKRWCKLDVEVDGEETERLFLWQGEMNGKAGYLYAYTCDSLKAEKVKEELITGGATIIGEITF